MDSPDANAAGVGAGAGAGGPPSIRSLRRPSVLGQAADDYPYSMSHSHRGPGGAGGPFSSLLRNRSTASLTQSLRGGTWNYGAGDEADETASMRGVRMRERDEDDIRRLTAEERRVSMILAGPQMRSMMLIGNSNPRYRWEKYWKTEAQLKAMKKPIRQYYERTNDLIQQYIFIDRLLDSSIPHDLLNDYSTGLDASAFSPVDVPHTITEEAPTPTSARGPATSASSTTIASADNKRAKRNRKDIFTSTEATPLLSRDDEEERGGDEEASIGHGGDAPKPYTPWLEDAQLDHDDPIVTLAIWVNIVANAILLAGKVVVVASVPSMSVLASLVDAVLDLLSTAIVWTTTRLISSSQTDQHRYPVGRRRLEPLGVLVFSIVMITSFFQVGLECIQRLLSPEHQILELGIPAVAIMVGTIVIKGAVWLWCRFVKNSSVRALADDAKTDVIFNTGSILFPIVGFYARIWWLDALGGLILSLVVMANWSQTSMHHMRNLTGFSAQPDERNLLVYLTMRFATAIKKVQNLRAYHAGDKLFVEVDIILEANMPLKDSHDLSEVLTYFLESVPIVDRAFVHVDYDSYNVPTHI